MDQKFEVTLVSTEEVPNALIYSKSVFLDLKGCTLLGAEKEESGEIVVQLQINGVEEPHNERLLKSFLSICTEKRRGLALKSVRPLGVRGVLNHVNKILVNTGAGRAS